MAKRVIKKVSAQEGLKLLGFDTRRAARGRVLVAIGPVHSKRYSFYYRKGDGHTLYRWGRLANAEVSYIDGELSTVRFLPDDWPYNQPGWTDAS